jgi:4a-hydroxytetrahydrobiopterin dehydratase
MSTDPPLHEQHCRPQGPEHALGRAAAEALLARLEPGWRLVGIETALSLEREFRLADFSAALALANAIGALAEVEDHHPDLELGWGRLRVRWSTHSAGGLTLNDFICAARCDRLR